jgi:hypothetical protein
MSSNTVDRGSVSMSSVEPLSVGASDRLAFFEMILLDRLRGGM